MPFQSKEQMKYMFMKHSDIAKRWEDKYGIAKNLPEHKNAKRTTKKKSGRSAKLARYGLLGKR